MTGGTSARTLVMDGAMGTRLIARGLDVGRDDPCLWNLGHPAEVRDVHRRDVRAGAEVLLANTFGANRPNLSRLAAADRLGPAIEAGVALARAEAPPGGLVLGSIGPILGTDEPREEYCRVVAALAEAGADGILLETHAEAAAALALNVARRATDLPILVSLLAWPDRPEDALKMFEDLGAAAVGFNCVVGLTPATRLARDLRRRTDLPLVVRPSAGLPGGELEPPDLWAGGVLELLKLGVRYLGGCCGTEAGHVAAIRQAVDGLALHPAPST